MAGEDVGVINEEGEAVQFLKKAKDNFYRAVVGLRELGEEIAAGGCPGGVDTQSSLEQKILSGQLISGHCI